MISNTAQGLDYTLGCDSEDDDATVNPRLTDEPVESTLRVSGLVVSVCCVRGVWVGGVCVLC